VDAATNHSTRTTSPLWEGAPLGGCPPWDAGRHPPTTDSMQRAARKEHTRDVTEHSRAALARAPGHLDRAPPARVPRRPHLGGGGRRAHCGPSCADARNISSRPCARTRSAVAGGRRGRRLARPRDQARGRDHRSQRREGRAIRVEMRRWQRQQTLVWWCEARRTSSVVCGAWY